MTVTLESLKKSVGKKNSKSEIFAWLADLERAAGDLDGALQRVDGGLTLYPNDVAAMIVRARILFQQEKFEECVKQCEIILVKDPFSLAGQKIMGDAYDKLGNVAERNLCYRRYHDMDPLNGFWKDEYDVVVETAVAATAAADLTMPDSEFSMPEDDGSSLFEKTFESESEKASADESLELPAEEEQGLFEKSSSSVGISLDDEQANNTASPFSKSPFEEIAEEQVPAMEMPSNDDDPFAALASMLPNSDAAEDSMMEDLSASLDATMADISANSTEDKPVEEFPVDDNISGTDVNSAMSNFFGLEDDLEVEETSGAGSKTALDETPVDESASANASMVFGSAVAEDKPMSVDNAFDSIFGEDELPEELPQEKPAVAEDKPMSVDNAFDSIFGDDELPEEKPQTETATAESLELPAEESLELPAAESLELPAEESLELPSEEPAATLEDSVSLEGEWSPTPKAEDNALSVDGAFSSIFGDDDDLPEEKPQTETAAEENLELPAEESLELPAAESLELPAEESLELPSEEPAATLEDSVSLEGEWSPTPKAEDNALSVDGAFSSIFGDDDDLPEEKPQTETAAAESLELPAEESLELPSEEPAATLEDSVSLEGEWSPTPKAEDNALSVDGAFSSIFGDDDDLPEEKPQTETAAEENLELPAEESLELPAEESLELPSEEPAATLEDSVSLDGEWSPTPKTEDNAFSVDGAFSSIFGDDDDLPEEKPQTETAAEENLELPAEESLELPAEESLELPAEETSMVSEVETPTAPVISSAMDFVLDDEPAATSEETAPAEEIAPATESGFSVDSAFDSLFGNDDDLPEEKSQTEVAAEEPAVDNASSLAERVDLAEAELEMPSVQKDESSDLVQEMGGAFASMFGDQDDLDLPELNESSENNVMKSAADDQQATGAAFEEASADKLESDLDKSFSSLFGNDDDLSLPEEPAQDAPAMQHLDSLESEVSGAFKGLFEMDDDSLNLDQDKPSNSGVDFLMSGDSDDEVSAGLINNPDAPLNRGAQELDDSLNTKTLAEIYFDQGLYGKALEIYKDLATKEPENQEIANRMAEVEKLYREKFGGNG